MLFEKKLVVLLFVVREIMGNMEFMGFFFFLFFYLLSFSFFFFFFFFVFVKIFAILLLI